MAEESTEREGPSHKVIVRVPPDVYRAIETLASVPNAGLRLLNETGVPRYAEIARVLLSNELLLRGNAQAPLRARVGVAVLSNSTLILAAAFARLTYQLQEELLDVSATVTRTSQDNLARLRAYEPGKQRTRSATPAPVINLTLDGWLYRSLIAYTSTIPATEVKETKKYRSVMAYAISALLKDAISRESSPTLIASYAVAVARVRTTLEEAVASEREAVREYLKQGKLI